MDALGRPACGRAGRVVVVDALRLLATVQMVEGHTLDAVLALDLRSGAAFELWRWARGLTSVAFLFAAGLSFYLATVRRLDAHLASRAERRRRFTRGATLIGVGYALRAPLGALAGGGASDAAWTAFLAVDVLHCIGATLLALELVVVVTRRRSASVVAAGVLGLVGLWLTPTAHALTAAGWSRAWAGWLTPSTGSLFPLVPWGAYMCLGVVAGALAFPAARAPAAGRGAAGLAVFAAAAWALASRLPPGPAADGVLKLAVVSAGSGALGLCLGGVRRLPRALERLAGETLVVYGAHVLLLYGAHVGLRARIGPRLDLVSALALAAVILAASSALGLGWRRLGPWLRGRLRGTATPARGLDMAPDAG